MSGQERRWLACHALGVSSAALLAHPELYGRPEVQALFRRREAGEPVQYILGEAPFFGRDFHVGPGVLIPRQDTETLITAALELNLSARATRRAPNDEPFTFLDWGTGSGCIAATLLLERPKSRALMVDRSPTALNYARENLERYGLRPDGQPTRTDRFAALCRSAVSEGSVGRFPEAEVRARLIQSGTPEDILLSEEERCALVISNPPYIPGGEIPGLMREVRDHEPREALDGGQDGMDYYRMLFRCSPRWLRPGGFLILEMGSAAQAEAFRASPPPGFGLLREFQDDGGNPRCAVWQYLV
ncbi:MAG: peptide chain release factor N(5)-glutamine methyltransferase [Fretibacterium sp.]|nr:peptide chain release factor N(5)-glutamine methyltransferase [Fretibacterium sp.]